MKMYEEYKDSRVKWIGEVPSHWKIAPIKRFLSGMQDGTHGTYQTVDSGYPLLSAKNVFDTGLCIEDAERKISKDDYYSIIANGYPQKGDIALCCVGTIGRCCIYNEDVPYAFQRSVTFLRCNEAGNNRFFLYCLKSQVANTQYRMYEKTSAQSGIYMGVLKTLIFPIPTFIEQHHIAAYLDAKTEKIDNMIAKAEKKIEYLGELKQSLITRTVTRGLNPNTPLKDSGVKWIGSVPYHWEIISLKRLLTNERDNLKVGPFGSQLQGKDIVDESEYWIYNQRSVLDNNFETTNSYITEEKFLDMSSFAVRKDDILITTRGTIGKIARVPQQYHKGIIHPCIIKFRIDKGKVHYPFIERLFNDSNIIKTEVKLSSNATTIEVIYGGTLKELHLPFPPLTEQQQIANYLDTKCSKIDHIIATQKKKIAYLQELKQSLITNVVTGKIKVS